MNFGGPGAELGGDTPMEMLTGKKAMKVGSGTFGGLGCDSHAGTMQQFQNMIGPLSGASLGNIDLIGRGPDTFASPNTRQNININITNNFSVNPKNLYDGPASVNYYYGEP